MGKLGQWLQVSANIGILAGLILVGLQINQNTELTRLNFYSSEEDGYLAMGATFSGETLAAAWAKAVEEPESLTTSEMVQVDGYLDNVWTQIVRREYLHTEGLYQVSGKSFIEWEAARTFGNVFAQAWWKERRKYIEDSRVHLKDSLDRAIASQDDEAHARRFDNIRSTIAARQNRT